MASYRAVEWPVMHPYHDVADGSSGGGVEGGEELYDILIKK